MSDDIPLVYLRDLNNEQVKRELLAYIRQWPGRTVGDFVFANRVGLNQAWAAMDELEAEGLITTG